jgi:hypothetical protein
VRRIAILNLEVNIMGYANVTERCGKNKKWHDVILRHDATMVNEATEEVIAKFTGKGDAYCWALEISKRFSDQNTLVID